MSATLVRSLSRATLRHSTRTLSTSVCLRKDFVQELYLNSLKAYKPSPQPADAHVGHVKDFHSPSAPKTPEIFSSSDLAKELDLYDKQTPSMASRSGEEGESTSSSSKGPMSKDEYLALLETPEKDGIHYGMAGVYAYNQAKGIHSGGGH